MTKIKCLKCGDIIESDKKGKWVECKCKSCYIDETEYYCRVGGNFDEYEIERKGKWVIAKKVIAKSKDNIFKKFIKFIKNKLKRFKK